MTMTAEQAAARIHGVKSRLAAEITKRHFQRRPELEQRYGPRGRAKCEEDAHFHLSYLAEAIAVERPELFGQYIAWAGKMLRSRGVPEDDLRGDLAEMLEVSAEVAPEVLPHARAAVEQALRSLEGREHGLAEPISDLARRYLEAALREGPLEASHFIDELVASGMTAADIYVGVLQPAMHELGSLWQLNKVSVAEEHYGTAVTQRIMAKIYSDQLMHRPSGALIVVACVMGELHELGARMLSDLLELAGYRTDYLGAMTPPAALVEYVCQRGTRCVALSASITPHLAQVRQTIQLLRADPRCRDVKVIVGGGAFNALPSLWRMVGADAWAADARSAVEETRRLLAS